MYEIKGFFSYDPVAGRVTLRADLFGDLPAGTGGSISFIDKSGQFRGGGTPVATGDRDHYAVVYRPVIGNYEQADGSLFFKFPDSSELEERFFLEISNEPPPRDPLPPSEEPFDLSPIADYLWFKNSVSNADYLANDGDDVIYVGRGDDRIFGENGDDYLDGGESADTLDGGTGADRIVGGAGADRLDGGAGARDTLDYQDSFAGVRVHLGLNTAAGGDAEGDVISGFERALGSALADTLSGDAQANLLHGYAGNDALYGGSRDDTLSGGAGADRLEGQRGADRLEGGAGADRFVFRDPRDSTYLQPGRDTILDFSAAQGDVIHLALMDADATAAGDQAFAFIGRAAFSGEAGELKVNSGHVLGDLDGDGRADFAIAVIGARFLQADDFVL